MNSNEIMDYYKTIKDLSFVLNIIFERQTRNVKCFLFAKDIRLIRKYSNIDLAKITGKSVSLLDQTLEVITPALDMEDIKNLLVILLSKLQFIDLPDNFGNQRTFDNLITRLDSATNYRIQDKIIFEKWFDIENVTFNKVDENSNSLPELQLPEYISKTIQSEDIKDNLKRNFAIIASLNKYVYGNYDIHKIVLSDSLVSNVSTEIPITANFNINMTKPDQKYYNGQVDHKIWNFPPDNKIHLENQEVGISGLSELIKNTIQKKTWEIAYNDAVRDFKHLEFGLEVKISIAQYDKKIKDECAKFLSRPDELKKIAEWVNAYPDAIYENLKALNDFVESMIAIDKQFQKDNNEIFHCESYKCSLFRDCCSHIHFFGVDCVTETMKHRENSFVKKDRYKKSSSGKKEYFWEHLRIISFPCDDPLWFLTLRIHFRRDEKNKKIEIGWIGRHLYLPCDTVNNLPECKRNARSDCPCPLHPSNYDKNLDDLDNFLRQYQ